MKYRINLLQEKEKDLSGKIIYFALHYLRYILVLTQIVVIVVFFYRFKIDQEVIDLRDELRQKQEIVQVSKPLLSEAASIDIKTKEIKSIITKQDSFSSMLFYFLNVFPSNMKVNKLNITENDIEFEGITSDPGIIKLFLNRLKSDNQFKTIQLGSIRRDEIYFYCPFKFSGYLNKK